MAEPVLESIEIEGFLSIRSATVQLGALNVLIGANGSGKSNLIRALETLGRIAEDGPASRESRDLLRDCRVFHFHETSRGARVKHCASVTDNLALHSDAANLAAVLLRLRDSEDETNAYRRIVGVVRQIAPFFRDFVLVPDADEIRLRWWQTGSDAVFSADQMSDGTFRFICLATLLLQPSLPRLVVLDEPELGLHPLAIVLLAELLRQASIRSRVLFATQSVTLISQFELGELIVAERRGGASEFHRPDPEALAPWLADYSLGELWEKNLLGGRPVREDGNC